MQNVCGIGHVKYVKTKYTITVSVSQQEILQDFYLMLIRKTRFLCLLGRQKLSKYSLIKSKLE